MNLKFIIIFFVFSSTYTFSQDTTKALFLGNSFTYFNDMPDLVKGLTNSAGINSEIEMYAPGGMYVYGTGTSGHDSSTVTESYILSNDWDYIVIQDNQGGYVWSQGYINPMITDANLVLYNKIKAHNLCTRIIYFAGWAMEGGLPSQYWNDGGLSLTSDNTQGCITRIYNQYVYFNDSLFNEIVTPIGLAWNKCLNNYPSIDLYSSDNTHPSLSGSYLAASTIFTSIFKINPTNLQFNGGLNDSIAEYLRYTGYNTVITDSIFNSTNLVSYTPELEFNLNEISTPNTYISYQWQFENIDIPGSNTNTYIIDTAGYYSLIVTDIDGCWHKSFNLFCDPIVTGISNNNKTLYNIYPNPAKDYIVINTLVDTETSIKIFDNTGKLYLNSTFIGKQFMDISDFNQGMYFITLENNSFRRIEKIIITD